ncbi:MAG: tRNA (N6-isopentenyl adenosine(37)-C2)-methylthiotransferase MiaB [Candidatus Omnitrophota bacterium]|nr:MAG: tRNA (N6-isopentenyl adenosine(37)-C2)-methylthiotransferase MiaB [Candidatus Omnitrophota bacterium]
MCNITMSKESKTYKNSPKKVYIRTFGCQMNDRDSEALAGLFLDKGYILTDNLEEAEIILVNTCSVREHAENRALSFLGSLKKITNYKLQITGCKRIVGVIGCMARNRGKELFKKMPYLDLVIGPANFDKIPHYVEKIKKEKTRIIDIEDRERKEDFYSSFRNKKEKAYIVISTGCLNFCSYCVVPYTRGPLRLRKPRDIIDEAKKAVDLGIKKITFLGQNVNDYQYKLSAEGGSASGGQIIDFVELLRMIEKIEGIEEIDFVTSHPKNTTKDLFFLMASSKKIKKHLHLPFQSGSNKILKLMGRGYTKEEYLNLVEAYKKIVKGTLSTDVIVGFPYEEEKDFLETKEVLEKVRFRYAYIFKYSPRPHTKAFLWQDTVSEEEKKKRHQILLRLQRRISLCGGDF